MEKKKFIRKKKEKKPVLAICYDFDKTLSPDDMQAQGFIQSVELDVEEFWRGSNELAERNDMDQNLAYMYKMIDESRGKQVFTRETLLEHGSRVKLFSGVEEWFERIKAYGAHNDVIVEHYIISSGLKEMIEGTSVAKNGVFEKIYASSFYYDKRGEARWPAQVVNYTNKTQFLFRIEKGVLDVNDPGVNEYFSPEDIRIPFRNIVYIGDSDTDVPCMKLVNANGGHSIGVYNVETQDKTKVYKMMRDNRIKYYVEANYCEGSDLDELVKAIIDRTASNELLESKHYQDKIESIKDRQNDNEESRKKRELIFSLRDSTSFASTHFIIKNLKAFNDWSKEDIDELIDIAIDNSQVRYILADRDVNSFYKMVLSKDKRNKKSKKFKKIELLLNNGE